jgi:hypothetical protein
MRIIHLTSISFTGYVEYVFNDNCLLDKMEFHADLSEKQQIFLLKNMPREIQELDKLKSANVTLTEMNAEVPTFDMFWKRYDDRVNSSKKRAKQKWNKMTPADQGRAYTFIPKYFMNIPAGTRKKFAETYLNAELWNN